LDENGITFSRIILLLGKCDLRKGIDGLAAMIKMKYSLNPMEKGTLFLFCGTKKDRLKGLLWLGDRFVMLYIRLAEGRFSWPRTAEEAREVNKSDFIRLMDGYSIESTIGDSSGAIVA